jgi:hypothetical protein
MRAWEGSSEFQGRTRREGESIAGVRPKAQTCAGNRPAAHQRRDRLAHGRRGLDAVAALRRRPEEAGQLGIGAAHQVAVGHEGAQPRPNAGGAADRERGHALDPVYGGGDVEFLGLHVVRRHRVGVGRRAEQHAGVGLEVPVFLDAGRQRPGGAGHAFGRREDEGRAALGLQADRSRAGERADRVGPGACGVQHQRRLERVRSGLHLPHVALAAKRGDRRIEQQRAAGAADAAKKSLVDGVHVHVGRVGLVDGADHLLAAQHRHEGAGLGRIEQAAARRDRLQHRPVFMQRRLLAVARHHHGAARAEQRVFGESFGRLLEEGAAGHREGAHLRRAVALHEERGRAAGGMEARLRLLLDEQHLQVRREEEARRRAGDAGADDDAVGGAGHACDPSKQILRIRKTLSRRR